MRFLHAYMALKEKVVELQDEIERLKDPYTCNTCGGEYSMPWWCEEKECDPIKD